MSTPASAAGRSSPGAACSIRTGLSHAKELTYAAACLTSIEINGTFYRTQTPATFHKWASEVPNGFKFSVKGVRYVTNRSVLAEAGDSIKRFIDSGVLELGDRLGPLLWQMNPYKKFDEADFGKFLELLPHKVGDQRVRHVVEVRHDSFKTPAFIALLRQFNVGIVYSEHETYTEIADVTSDFVYARLQKGDDSLATGYPPKALDAWAGAAEGLGQRRPAGRPAARRQEGRAEATARRVRLRDPRRQGARAGAAMELIKRARRRLEESAGRRAKKEAPVHHRLPADTAQGRARRARERRCQAAGRRARGRRFAPPGILQEPAFGGAERARHRLSAPSRARHADGRPPRRARRRPEGADDDLCQAPEDAAGEAGDGRAYDADRESRSRLHPLLRARPRECHRRFIAEIIEERTA